MPGCRLPSLRAPGAASRATERGETARPVRGCGAAEAPTRGGRGKAGDAQKKERQAGDSLAAAETKKTPLSSPPRTVLVEVRLAEAEADRVVPQQIAAAVDEGEEGGLHLALWGAEKKNKQEKKRKERLSGGVATSKVNPHTGARARTRSMARRMTASISDST